MRRCARHNPEDARYFTFLEQLQREIWRTGYKNVVINCGEFITNNDPRGWTTLIYANNPTRRSWKIFTEPLQ